MTVETLPPETLPADDGRTEEERLADQYYRDWLDQFPQYAKDMLKIETTKGQLSSFTLNPIQQVFLEVVEHIKAEDRLVRIMVLKARRMGISTLTAGRFFHVCATTPYRKAMMISHEPDSSSFLFGMQKRYFDNLPEQDRPSTRYNNMKILDFNLPRGQKGGLDSAIRVATAGKEDVGSSQLIHHLHLSELAKWPAHVTSALLTSVMQCVPDTDDSEVIIESTAKGIGGAFYGLYWAAKYKYIVGLDKLGQITWKCEVDPKAPKGNTDSAIFFPWFVFPTYQMPVKRWEKQNQEKFRRTDKEQEFVDLHMPEVDEVIVNRKLCWARATLAGVKCQNNPKKFMQEYPATPMEAFISSGNAVFDAHEVMKRIEEAPDPIAYYDISPAGSFFAKDFDDNAVPLKVLQVWDEPEPGQEYLVSADIAEGIEVLNDDGESKYDFTSVSVFNLRSGKQAAHWYGHIDYDLVGDLMCFIGKRYNTGWLAPERNNHGLTVVAKIIANEYPNCFVEVIPEPPNKSRKRYGWKTGTNKALVIDELAKAFRNGDDGIRSKIILNEMLSFKRDEKGKYGAEEGMHDDGVMDVAINKKVATIVDPLPTGVDAQGDGRPGWNHKGHVVRTPPPISSWT